MSSQQRLRRDHDAGTKRLLAEDQPQRNVCVRIDMLTIPTTPLCNQFYLQTEQWIYCHYTGSYAGPRPEWSKGWAYTAAFPWTNTTMLKRHHSGRG